VDWCFAVAEQLVSLYDRESYAACTPGSFKQARQVKGERLDEIQSTLVAGTGMLSIISRLLL